MAEQQRMTERRLDAIERHPIFPLTHPRVIDELVAEVRASWAERDALRERIRRAVGVLVPTASPHCDCGACEAFRILTAPDPKGGK